MIRKLITASAGAGKTERIISETQKITKSDQKVLIITYTKNNQKELISRLSLACENYSHNFVVKGLFTFLLEDIIRPYQRYLFSNRIEDINFNSEDPHKRNGKTIYGRTDVLPNKNPNPDYYLTQCRKKAHTAYLAKLATKIISESQNKPINRLDKIYHHIYIDEVQDLIGWDYEVIKQLSKSNSLNITCVGDFRQTIYDTSVASKGPKTSEQKLESFQSMKFQNEPLAISHRSIQSICDFADQIHENEGYTKTISQLKNLPESMKNHVGVFCVRESNINKYIQQFKPVLLRYNVNSGIRYNNINILKYNFGKSKGLSFDRTLIIPTQSYLCFICGEKDIFKNDKTDEPKNKLYVAITRARYSVAFVIPDTQISKCLLKEWENTN